MNLKGKLQLGYKLIKEDKYPDALQVYAEAYIIDPYNEETNKCIAFLWQRINEGNYDFTPETAEQFIMRGNARLHKQEYNAAFADYSKAIALDNECDYAYKCRGFVLALTGKHKEAHKEYVIATKLNPKRGEYWDDAATSFEALGDVVQAHLCHEQAVKASPDDARLWYNYGIFFAEHLNDAKMALEKFNKAIEIFPKFEDAIVNRDQLLEFIQGKG